MRRRDARLNIGMAEDFLSWALAGSRSLEERFFVEILLENGLSTWKIKTSQPFEPKAWEREAEKKKARKLNPAHRPEISTADLERALPYILSIEALDLGCRDDRPIRDLGGLRFLASLTSLKLFRCELTTLVPILELPALERLSISEVARLEDYSPIAECRGLRRLELFPEHPWPNLGKLENLMDLEELSIGRNPWLIEELGQRACYPKLLSVSFATAYPLRDATKLPAMPVIRRFELKSVCRLDGLERYSSVEELTVGGNFREAGPICDLPKLTHLTCETDGLTDVSPLTRLPELRNLTVASGKPRDYSPMVEAPKLRQITASGDGARVNEMELVAINAALSPWDDDFALPVPRPCAGPIHIVCFPDHPSLNAATTKEYGVRNRSEALDYSKGMQRDEANWFEQELNRITTAAFGPDWTKKGGHTSASCVWITQFAYVERIPELVEALRSLPAKSRVPRTASIFVAIDPDDDEEEEEWEEASDAVQRYEDDVSYQKWRAEHLDLLERQYRFQLRKQTEEEIDPESFSKPLVEPEPVPMPAELLLEADDDDEDDDDFEDEEDDSDRQVSSISMNCYFQFDQANLYMVEADLHLAKYLLGRGPDEFRRPMPAKAKKVAQKKAPRKKKDK